MDTLIAVAGKDYVIVAADASQIRSIMVIKEAGEDKILGAIEFHVFLLILF